ncbi:hypothetical protein BGZ91_002475 [Linnemannia elongata]|nr:hypothetical protein BGZ91_002475 [Linnemannia elongata]
MNWLRYFIVGPVYGFGRAKIDKGTEVLFKDQPQILVPGTDPRQGRNKCLQSSFVVQSSSLAQISERVEENGSMLVQDQVCFYRIYPIPTLLCVGCHVLS